MPIYLSVSSSGTSSRHVRHSRISRFFRIVGFPSAVNKFSSEVTVFVDNEIVMVMTDGGFDTVDETEENSLNLKLKENNNGANNANNIYFVKLSIHNESSSGLSFSIKFIQFKQLPN